MSPRYERVNSNDEDRDSHGNFVGSLVQNPSQLLPPPPQQQQQQQQPQPQPQPIPSSPPPPFHSVVNSLADSTLEDSFDAPSDDEDGDMRNPRSRKIQNPNTFHESIPLVPTTTLSYSRPGASSTQTNTQNPVAPSRRVIGESNDGVFANLNAKPTVGEEKLEEQPPSYEQAAADAPPPFWETTILAPGIDSNEVYIDGLPVGSVFAFVWNAMISTFFQLVGFLLTYLLHTTHAAKNGSRAGLGITLIQYGFYLRSGDNDMTAGPPAEAEPTEPNSYEFSSTDGSISETTGSGESIGRSEWLSYSFMIVGWFILLRALTDFLRARRTEQVVLQSPDRGLGIAVVAENENPERSV